MHKTEKFEARISDYQKINPDFAKVKIYVMYTGKNRNGTYFTKEMVESKMIPTIFNIPVVGEWIEEDDDFGTHGGKIEISDRGIKYVETTKPYGVIGADSEIKWETVREKDGLTENEYLTCTAYLWIGRYPEIEKVLDGNCNQSMEIMINEGTYNESGNYYEISDAYFSALCILGSEVEPCFESASVKAYSLDKDKFKHEFNEMIKELKFTLDKGGENVLNEKLDKIAEFTTLTEEDVADLKENLDSYTLEELEVELKTRADAKETENHNADNSDENTDNNADNEIFEGDNADNDEEENKEDFSLEDLKSQIETKDTLIFNLNTELSNLRKDFDALNEEVVGLREYKSKAESEKDLEKKEDIFTEFSIGLSEEEMKPVRDKIKELSLNEIKSNLNEIFALKNLEELKKKKFSNNDEEIHISIPRKNIEKSRYACD